MNSTVSFFSITGGGLKSTVWLIPLERGPVTSMGGFWPVNDSLSNAKYLQKYMRPGLQKRLDYNKMRNALHRYVPFLVSSELHT